MNNPRKPAWEKWRGMDMEERKGRAAVWLQTRGVNLLGTKAQRRGTRADVLPMAAGSNWWLLIALSRQSILWQAQHRSPSASNFSSRRLSSASTQSWRSWLLLMVLIDTCPSDSWEAASLSAAEAPGRGTASTTAGMAEPMTGSMGDKEGNGITRIIYIRRQSSWGGGKYKLVLYKINTNTV